jgi:hypothetical protein
MPAYHMRIMDLDAIQAAERNLFMKKHREERVALCQKHHRDRVELRQQHRDARLRAKAEKALHDKSKVEPDFWTYFPNHEGRRDTMEAVLKSLGKPVGGLDAIMPAYAAWLLTANKMHENGRPKNRWALMTAFVVEALRAPTPPVHEVAAQLAPPVHEVEAQLAPPVHEVAPPGEVERMLKPESVIVQMLIERGDLVVGHII